VPQGVSLDHLVGNADLAPTIAELAGVDAPADADGRSFAPLLGTDPPPASAWRQAYPLSHADGSSANPPAWYGVRTPRYTYVRYATGERELYDDLADPWQLQSLDKAAPAPLLSGLDALASTLAGCAGAACRAAEDPPTPGTRRPWRSGSRP